MEGLGWSAVMLAGSVELNSNRRRVVGLRLNEQSTIGGVRFLWLRVPLLGARGPGVFRLLNMLVFAGHLLLSGAVRRLPEPNVIVGSTVHPFAAWAASRLARRYGVPFVFEIRDLWPETLIALGAVKRGSGFARLLFGLERRLATEAARIITTMPRAFEYLEQAHGVPPEKVAWVSNGITVEPDQGYEPPMPAPEFRLVYIGAHGTANSLETLVEAVALLGPDFPIECRLYGVGAEKPRLEAMCRSLGIERVTFEAPVPKHRLPEVALKADAFVLCSREVPELYKYGVSMNKIFDYMYLGRPVIAALDAADDPVSAARAGIVVPPESPERLATAIREMAEMPPATRAEIGLRARNYVIANFSYEHLGQKFAEVLESTL